VKCRSCAADIADKAIVCYRCGTPTAVPAPPAGARGRRGRRMGWIVPLLVIVALAILAWVGLSRPE
jgi:hypothetical protein